MSNLPGLAACTRLEAGSSQSSKLMLERAGTCCLPSTGLPSICTAIQQQTCAGLPDAASMLCKALHSACAAAYEGSFNAAAGPGDHTDLYTSLNKDMPQSTYDSGQAHPGKALHRVYTAAHARQDQRSDRLCYTDMVRLDIATGQAHLMAVVVTCCRGWKNCSKVNGCLQHEKS